MATVATLRAIIVEEIDDDSFSSATIDSLINRAIKATSKEVLLPVLETSASVNSVVGNPNIDISTTNFGHNLFHAATASGKVTVLPSMAFMLEMYPMFGVENIPGEIDHCCISGRTVAIHPVPTVITPMKIFFHGWPTILTANDDVGVYIDGEDNQEDIIVNFVLWRLHNKLEDALEGNKPNSVFHRQAFLDAVNAFSATIKQGQSRPKPPRGTWSI